MTLFHLMFQMKWLQSKHNFFLTKIILLLIFKLVYFLRLHEFTDISAKEASYLILAYAHRFSLSAVAKDDLLALIKLLLPSPCNLPKSFSKMETEYINIKECIREEKLCSSCKRCLAINEHCEE